ncbi:phenylacetate--CoA ligase family protein [Oceanobacillus jeddahense]|uniref:phenylacetate--CoA ligase family protein n=1 Tax=Oceanobacillus jeddahense TaxID=1462527 RepID=UPI0005961180|nr:phenylacetate--CoA ligase family protein [Oceanobacillus jeddahense]
MLDFIKRNAFWTLDFFRGSKVRKAYKNLNKYYHLDSNSSKLEKYQKKTLNSLLDQAVNNTIYYKKFKNKKDLSSFPVVNKKKINDKQEEFLSKKYTRENLIQMSTSGSTGTPFVSYQNINKKRCVNAETIFFNGKAGYNVGSKLVYLRSLNLKNNKTKLKQKIQNEKLIDIAELDDTNIEYLFEQIERFTNKQSATMLSYASTYDTLSNYFKKYGFDKAKKCNIHGILSTSEILFDETRRYMSEAFNCNCYSRYANMENGMLGQDTPKHPNTFILNEANYYIEILRMDSDIPADFGETGRIVVTDLYNYAMPMIRYDTGDVGTFTYVDLKGKKKKAITNFGGRKIDMITDVKGNTISPHKISVTFWNFPELKQFQFIQEDNKTYSILLMLKTDFDRGNELIDKLKAILGEKAVINIKVVESIPVLDSGKRKYIINKNL